MHDLKWLRENAELVTRGAAAKNTKLDLTELLDLDKNRRALLQEVEDLKCQRNQANEQITQYKKSGENDRAQASILSMKTISQKIKEIDQEVGELSLKIDKISLVIPNIPDISVPVGEGTSANKVVRTWGEPKKFSFNPKDQMDLGKEYFSLELGSKITGSGFPVYRGKGARLQRALINFMMDLHAAKHGYEEVWPPTLVNRQTMIGTGQLPKFEEDMYALRDEDYFLIPTAEVPVTNLYREEILKESDLPLKFVAYTPCFRREAGSYGKDTKGISRVHQFDKVELVKLVKPETSFDELELLVTEAEAVLQALELPYRVLLLGSGDMGFSAAKCYDLEVWAPGSNRWFEVSSCSVFGDFQARRMNLRYRKEEDNKPAFVHTLNGSGVALARTFLCILENHQQEDGTIKLPKVLEKYL